VPTCTTYGGITLSFLRFFRILVGLITHWILRIGRDLALHCIGGYRHCLAQARFISRRAVHNIIIASFIIIMLIVIFIIGKTRVGPLRRI